MVFVIWPLHSTCRSKARLVGKTVAVTGGNTGIGKEVVRDMYRRGARAILMCRDLKRGQQAIDDIKQTELSRSKEDPYEGEPGEIALYQLNLTSFTSIKECAKKVLQSEPSLHILINNAGVMACAFQKTEDGFETHIQTNHLGHFLLTLLLLPKMQATAGDRRIINVASALHFVSDLNEEDINNEKSFGTLKAYGHSKLANILFTKELAKRFEQDNITGINVYSLHPGVVMTELARYFGQTLVPVIKFFGTFFNYIGLVKSPPQGAQTTIHCAVSEEAANETGLYYSECRPTNPTSTARNKEKARALWEISCKSLGLDPKLSLNELSKQALELNFQPKGTAN